MPAAALPSDEAARLRVLRAHHILDTPEEEAFDDLTRQAMEACDTPIGTVALVDEKRQWFKSHFGLEVRETPREHSVCAHALLNPDQPLIVPDLKLDPRFADNPLVTGENGIRFYAGVPLRSLEGHGLGTLCVIDHVPRKISPEQIDRLRAIAHQVSIRLSLRRRGPAERWLALGFGVSFALLLCLATVFAMQASRFLASDAWMAQGNQVIRDVERTLFEVQAAESSQRGYTASGQEGYLPPYQKAVASLPGDLAVLRTAISDNRDQIRLYDALQTEIDNKLAIMEERLQQRRDLGRAALDAKYLNGSGRRSMEAIIATGQQMIEVENGLLRARATVRARDFHAAVGLLWSASTVGACLLGAGFFLTRRELRRRHVLGGALAHANRGLENEIADHRRAQQRLHVQHAIAHVAAENVSLAEAAPSFLRGICEHLDWELGEIWTVDPAAAVLRLADRWYRAGGPAAQASRVSEFVTASEKWTFAEGQGLPGRVWREGVSAWDDDLANSGGFPCADVAQRAGLRRAFALPLRAGHDQSVTGVMVFLSREPDAPDAGLVTTMGTLTGQIAQFTERCRAEARLRASQARFTAFMENAPPIAYIKDEDGRMLYGNQTLLRRFGLRADEWLGKTDFDFWPDVAHKFRAIDNQVLAGTEAMEVNETVPEPDGGLSHWLSYKFPLQDEVTGRKLLAGMSIDITARERAESALRAEREFLAALLDNVQAGVVACDARGELTHCNRAAIALYGFPAEGPLPAFEQWDAYFDLLPEAGGEPRRGETNPLAGALRGEVMRDQEFILRPKHGPERTLSLNVSPFEDGHGKRLGAVAVIHDVTARRQAQETALVSLREKETLLQEVHHRVKNNLQIIGSLLSMQARRTRAPAALAALRESAGRVKSIALVHEKLYGSADLECIEAADYLRTLSRNLMDALGAERLQHAGRVALGFELEVGHHLDASVAIACGLIVNEALTNCLKHGFPDQRSGQVTVALTHLEDRGEPVPEAFRSPCERVPGGRADRWLRLEVRDNGVGVPPEALTPAGTAELTRHSLGMRLVRDLSKQAGGRFEFVPTDAATGAGLTLRVVFPARAAPLRV